jgi:hypothetical protein
VLVDEMASHGFHPEHGQRLAAYWESRSVVRRPAMETRLLWSGYMAATVRTRRWTGERSSALLRHWLTSPSPTTGWDGAARLLWVGGHHDDVPIPPLRR